MDPLKTKEETEEKSQMVNLLHKNSNFEQFQLKNPNSNKSNKNNIVNNSNNNSNDNNNKMQRQIQDRQQPIPSSFSNIVWVLYAFLKWLINHLTW